jgi:hypothetical protein
VTAIVETHPSLQFKLCDLDDDGVICIKEIELLNEVRFERMRITGNKTIPFSDISRQFKDMVRPGDRSLALTSFIFHITYP